MFREGRGSHHADARKIGDLVLKNMNQSTMDHYYRYIGNHTQWGQKKALSHPKNGFF